MQCCNGSNQAGQPAKEDTARLGATLTQSGERGARLRAEQYKLLPDQS